MKLSFTCFLFFIMFSLIQIHKTELNLVKFPQNRSKNTILIEKQNRHDNTETYYYMMNYLCLYCLSKAGLCSEGLFWLAIQEKLRKPVNRATIDKLFQNCKKKNLI